MKLIEWLHLFSALHWLEISLGDFFLDPNEELLLAPIKVSLKEPLLEWRHQQEKVHQYENVCHAQYRWWAKVKDQHFLSSQLL